MRFSQTKTGKVKCPKCGGEDVIRKGTRKVKLGIRQFYYCKNCGGSFVNRKLTHKTYNPKIIVNAINSYNLGNTLEEAAKLTNSRFKVNVSKSSVHSWLNEFKNICPYHNLRTEILKKYGKDIMVTKTFEHNGLNYNFKYHKGKTDILCNHHPPLAEYLKGFENGCPEFFENNERCSQLKIDITPKKSGSYNLACKLAGLALKAAGNNKERHTLIENFMLINDSSTIACEVPVWLWEKNINAGVCGHIDILQIRNNKIYILDYKPNANRENEKKVASQLFLYASGMSFRTKIPLTEYRCAWFDEHNYYEFNPADAKVKYPPPAQKKTATKTKTRTNSGNIR
jgi:transposase-like protein